MATPPAVSQAAAQSASQAGGQLPATPQLSQGQGWYSQFKKQIGEFVQWLFDWTFAAKMAWIVFFVLAAIVALFWTMLWNPNAVPWVDTLSLERYQTVALVIFIPLIVYRMIGAWTTNVESHHPDIKSAWSRGLKDLKGAGIRIDATPVFLIVGSGDQRLERRIMTGLDETFLVKPAMLDNHPIHWYANRKAIYLYCTDCSWASRIAERVNANRWGTGSVEPLAAQDQEAEPSESQASVNDESPHPPMIRRGGATVDLDSSRQFDDFEQFGTKTSSVSGSKTLNWDDHQQLTEPVLLTAEESADQLQRLAYCCRMLQSVREPLCPINGVLVLTPFQILEKSDAEVEQYHRAIRADLLTVQQTLMLKVPVMTMFYGLEAVRGFQELVRRIGPAGSQTRRFGKAFELRAAASVPEMLNYSSHLTGVFEDWIYKLFCEHDALTHPGNNLLYELLSTIRTRLKTHLASLLSLGFGHDLQTRRDDELICFGGCYFASTGSSSPEQAFFRAVFAKLQSLQEEVEWTSTAIRRQSRLSLSVTLGVLTLVVGGLSLTGMYLWN